MRAMDETNEPKSSAQTERYKLERQEARWLYSLCILAIVLLLIYSLQLVVCPCNFLLHIAASRLGHLDMNARRLANNSLDETRAATCDQRQLQAPRDAVGKTDMQHETLDCHMMQFEITSTTTAHEDFTTAMRDKVLHK